MRLGEAIGHLLDFCYPTSCAACEAPAPGRTPLCERCDKDLRQLADAPACDRCALPLSPASPHCPRCNGKGLWPFDRVVRLGVFDDPLKRLIHHVKYHGRWPLAEFLADRLVEHEPAKGLLTHTELLVPVPLHPLRQIVRGYNQAEVMARRIGRSCKIKVAAACAVRLRHTETQTQLHSHARRVENLRDAFGQVKPSAVQGRHVVLVDDVMTTGATLQALARALREAKPASLSALVIAVADRRHRDFETL